MLRNLVVILITITLPIPAVSVIGQEKTKTDTQTKTDTKPTSDAAKNTDNSANKAEDKEKTEEEASLLRERGLSLLRQAGDEAADIKDQQIAAKIVATAADALWTSDRENALRLFEKAFDIALVYYRNNKQVEAPVTPGVRMTRSDTRMEIINMVAHRDSALARKYTAQYVEEKKEQSRDLPPSKINEHEIPYMGNVPALASELIVIARSILPTDPKLSIETAQQSISLGISSGVASYLAQLAASDRAAADRLYVIALNRVALDRTSPPGQLLLLSAYPFGEGNVVIMGGSGGSSSMSFGAPKKFPIDPQMVQTFLAAAMVVLSRVFDSSDPQSPDTLSVAGVGLYAARSLESKVEAFQPSMLAQWEEMRSRLSGMTPVNSRLNIDASMKRAEDRKNGVSNSAPADRTADLLDQAEKEKDPGKKDDLYRQAGFMIFRTGDIDRALNIIDKISDPVYRAASRSWLCYDAAGQAIKDKNFDDARRFALQVDETDQSAVLFIEMAKAEITEKDRVRATQLLDEARTRALVAVSSNGRVNALLGIASVYSTIDPLRAFEVIADAVGAANKLPEFGTEANYLKREISSKGRSSQSSISQIEDFDFGKSLAVLSKTDFDRSLLLAQSLDGKPLRLTSVISIAASTLETKKPRPAPKQ